ncbi:MAG: TatD family hydrolase [Thermofilaceae archaeon]
MSGKLALMRYTDAHCHAHEFPVDELTAYQNEFDVIVAVSDDFKSSLRTVALADKFKFIKASIGIHPWSLGEINVEEQLHGLEKLIARKEIICLGEIGLDRAFTPHTIERQLTVFRRLLQLAKDYDLAVNLHAAKSWKQVLDEVVAYGIKRVLFHWYSGPPEILAEISAKGYIISINPTVKVSKKHLIIAKQAPLQTLTFESDGPYMYRGMALKPSLIPETLKLIAKVRELDVLELVTIVNENLFKFLGI